MAEYDLSKTIIPYLDRHLSFPLLAHLEEIQIFPVEEVHVANMSLQEAQTCLITLYRSLSKSIQGIKFLQVMNWNTYLLVNAYQTTLALSTSGVL
jgi:hypothetical protein